MEQQNSKPLLSSLPPPPKYSMFFDSDDTSTYPSPPSPVEDTYMSFGVEKNVHDSLLSRQDMGIPVICTKSSDRRQQLKQLHHALLVSFKEIVSVLVDSPAAYPSHCEKIRLLLFNFQQILNRYRPHQALEKIESNLKMQQKQMKDTVERVQNLILEINNNIQHQIVSGSS